MKDGETICRYIMFACNVDHDGDRYGFVRNMKSRAGRVQFMTPRGIVYGQLAQSWRGDRSRTSSGRGRNGRVRTAWSLPMRERREEGSIRADDSGFDFADQMKLMENVIAGTGGTGRARRALVTCRTSRAWAIQLLRQAAIAELGPYILGYKGWKIRFYRALFNAVQRAYWTAGSLDQDDGTASRCCSSSN